MSEVEVIETTKEIAAYSPILKQLAEIKAGNASIVFDYEDSADNKRARSYVFQLRKLKALTDKERKAAKAESLAYGRRVDSEAKKITVEIEEMIDVHAVPIAAIEQREVDRIAAIKERIEAMAMALESVEYGDSSDLSKILAVIKAVAIDDSFAEFATEAAKVKDATITKIETVLNATLKAEAEQVELEKLRKEADERAIKDREEQIRREAAEKALAIAEEKRLAEIAVAEEAQGREREAAEKRELELKLTAEKAERERLEAQRRADRAEVEAREKLEAEKVAKVIEEQKRREDKERVAAVKAEILAAIKGKDGKQVVDMLVDGKIPFTTVSF